MTHDQWTGNDLNRSGCGQTEVLSYTCLDGMRKNCTKKSEPHISSIQYNTIQYNTYSYPTVNTTICLVYEIKTQHVSFSLCLFQNYVYVYTYVRTYVYLYKAILITLSHTWNIDTRHLHSTWHMTRWLSVSLGILPFLPCHQVTRCALQCRQHNAVFPFLSLQNAV
jgi:hypothetical protein